MLKYNKYLKELGIKEDSFPFAIVEGDNRYIEDQDGFRDCEFFNMDATLAMIIYSYLCYFRDNCLVSYPSYMEPEEWHIIVDKMIEAFKLYIVEDEDCLLHDDKERKIISKNRNKKINYGMKLFIKYFGHLWF